MSIRIPTLMTAGLLGILLVAGSFASVQAGEGRGCDKDKKKGDSTATLWCPASTLGKAPALTSERI